MCLVSILKEQKFDESGKRSCQQSCIFVFTEYLENVGWSLYLELGFRDPKLQPRVAEFQEGETIFGTDEIFPLDEKGRQNPIAYGQPALESRP